MEIGINLLTNRDVVWKNQATCPRPKGSSENSGFLIKPFWIFGNFRFGGIYPKKRLSKGWRPFLSVTDTGVYLVQKRCIFGISN